jgi:uncharacterized protein (DUF736 family)
VIIGKFTRTSDGWSGTIQTVTTQTKVRLVPNDKRENERAPDFRVVAGHCELGVAWRRMTQGDAPREFLSVMLDDPFASAPLSAALFETSKPGEANLVWKRSTASEVVPDE